MARFRKTAADFDDEEIALSRERLAIPADWEWYPCANHCGDVVWTPPGVGDVPKVEPVCSQRCANQLIINRGRL